jgi:hypothetical protein
MGVRISRVVVRRVSASFLAFMAVIHTFLSSGIQSRGIDTVICTQRGAAMQDVALLSGPETKM